MRLAPRGRFAQQNKTGFTSPPDHARRAAAAPQAPRLPHARVWRVAESSRVSGLLLRRLRRASVGMFTMGRALRVGRQGRVEGEGRCCEGHRPEVCGPRMVQEVGSHGAVLGEVR